MTEKELHLQQLRLTVFGKLMWREVPRSANNAPRSLTEVLKDVKRITDFIITGELDAKSS